MLSRLIQKGIFFCSCILLFACEKDGGTINSYPASLESVDQLNEAIQGINFVGTTPNGQKVSFSLSQQFSQMGQPKYGQMEGFQFAKDEQVVIDLGDGEESLGYIEMIDPEGERELYANFEFVFCTTFDQLRNDYPQLAIALELGDVEFYVALSQPDHTILEVFEKEIRFEDYLVSYIRPGEFNIVNNLETQFGVRYSFIGDFFKENQEIISYGDVNGTDLSYRFELSCPN